MLADGPNARFIPEPGRHQIVGVQLATRSYHCLIARAFEPFPAFGSNTHPVCLRRYLPELSKQAVRLAFEVKRMHNTESFWPTRIVGYRPLWIGFDQLSIRALTPGRARPTRQMQRRRTASRPLAATRSSQALRLVVKRLPCWAGLNP